MRRQVIQTGVLLALAVLIWISGPVECYAESGTQVRNFLSVGIDPSDGLGKPAVIMEIFLLMTVLSLAPAILIMLTSFTRIVMVLSLLRQAMGTHQMPPNQVIIGIALFLSIFIMTPIWQAVNTNALQPYLNESISRD